MDTQGVRLFILAAEKLNIGAAGRQLGLAPAAASARLAKLERTLGADLLRRSTRKVALSLEGAEFLPFAREIVAQEDAARAALGLSGATATGVLRFAAPSSFAQLYIAPLLPEFLERHPGVSLDLRFSDSPFDLIEGSFDLALRSAALADSGLKTRKLADDRRIFCAAPSYLERFGAPLTADHLASHHLIGFRNYTPSLLIGPDGSSSAFELGQTKRRVVLDDGLSLKLVTLSGAGISINSLWSVHRELSSGSLIEVLPDHEIDDDVALWLVYPKSNVLTAKVRVFIDFLVEKIGKSPPWIARQK